MASLKRKAGAELAAVADPKKAKAQSAQSSLMSFFATPKSATTGAAGGAAHGAAAGGNKAMNSVPAGPKFDKAKWVARLTQEQKDLLSLEIDTLEESWLAALKDDLVSPSFLELKRFLERESNAKRKIFPPPEDVYSWSRYTPLNSVKVVIVGQDPYHNDGQAHGLAFSVKPPVAPPPSLRNMYQALRRDYPGTFVAPPATKGGLLTPWAQRGVLLLNTCLTVRAHEANSHANHGWERFTQRVLELVAQRRSRGVVFMAWGSPAAKRVAKIDSKRHLVLRSVHPSPLSAHRGFFECRHFRTANEWLIKQYGPDGEIDWSLQDGASTIEVRPAAVVEVSAAGAGPKKDKEAEEEGEAEKKVEEPVQGKVTAKEEEVADKAADKALEKAREKAKANKSEAEGNKENAKDEPETVARLEAVEEEAAEDKDGVLA